MLTPATALRRGPARRHGAKGFTLIELMVVIAIIGLLAAIISVSLVAAEAKGRDAKRISDIRTIQLALEEYYSDHNSYPDSIYGNSAFAAYIAGGVVPCDPSAPSGGCSNSAYQYKYDAWTSGHDSICLNKTIVAYHLGAVLEDATNVVLTQDADEGSSGTVCGNVQDFVGASKDCGSAASTPDQCYDVTN